MVEDCVVLVSTREHLLLDCCHVDTDGHQSSNMPSSPLDTACELGFLHYRNNRFIP